MDELKDPQMPLVKKHRTLSGMERRMLDEYLVDFDAKAAAVRAGYSNTFINSGRWAKLWRDPAMQFEVERRLRIRAEQLNVQREDVVRELVRIGLGDPRQVLEVVPARYDKEGRLLELERVKLRPSRDWSDSAAAMVAEVECTEFKGEKRTRVKFHDKHKHLELLAKMMGWVEKGGVNVNVTQQNVQVQVSQGTPEQELDRRAEIMKHLAEVGYIPQPLLAAADQQPEVIDVPGVESAQRPNGAEPGGPARR